MKIIRKIGNKLFYRGGIFHPTKGLYLDWNKDLELAIENHKKIINIGAGQYHRIRVINVDPAYKKEEENKWTIRAYGENLPFDDLSIDFVVCGAVLEHVKNPEKIINEIYRVLKRGGRTYIDMPFVYPYHAAPSDYNRTTLSGLENLCKKFKKIKSGICLGPGSSLAQSIVTYNQIFFKNKLIKKIFKNITKIIVSPLKYSDKFLAKKKESLNLAAAVYFYGRKT